MIGSKAPLSSFLIQLWMMRFGPGVLYRLDQSKLPNVTMGYAFTFLNWRIIWIFSTRSETHAIPELELVAHVYLFMVIVGSHRYTRHAVGSPLLDDANDVVDQQ